MNVQGLIERYEKFKASKKKATSVDLVLKDLRSLDEPEPLPFKLKDVVGRIRGFEPMTQVRWLDGILKELGSDYGSMKYRSGYEQGKIEGMVEREKVKVPPFVAVWYEINKENLDKNIAYLCLNNWGEFRNDKTLFNWMSNTDNFVQTLVNMHQFGYEVEEEKRYLVKIKGNIKENMLVYGEPLERHFFTKSLNLDNAIYSHTRKELEEAGFGWVFDCPGIEIEEVE